MLRRGVLAGVMSFLGVRQAPWRGLGVGLRQGGRPDGEGGDDHDDGAAVWVWHIAEIEEMEGLKKDNA